MGYSANHLSEPRQKIIQYIKNSGASTMSELASLMNISTEAARQHLLQLEKEGWTGGIFFINKRIIDVEWKMIWVKRRLSPVCLIVRKMMKKKHLKRFLNIQLK